MRGRGPPTRPVGDTDHGGTVPMRRFFFLAATALLSLTGGVLADGLGLHSCCPTCKPIPCPNCPDCSCACDHRLSLTLFSAEHAQCLIETLQCGNACERLAAAKKLGSRFHADFCCNPCVLEALINALECDPCWEVRRTAAWAILGQGARTENGVLALYIASKADPHYLVRARAAEALDILTVCRAACYKDLYAQGDVIIKRLKELKWKPGVDNCREIFCTAVVAASAPPTVPAPTIEKPAEKLPTPKTSLELVPTPETPRIAVPTTKEPRVETLQVLPGSR